MSKVNYKINTFVEPHYPIKRSLLVYTASATLDFLKVKGKIELAISIVGDRKMRKLNKEYRGMDSTTDVLSFPYALETGKSQIFVNPPSKYLNIGDVISSYPELIDRAAKENMMVDDMASVLVIHGVLHLLGYNHEKPHDAVEMEKLEDQIFTTINAGGPLEQQRKAH